MQPDSAGRWLGPHASATVLVVDDEESIRDFLHSALEAEGYHVMQAENGVRALIACEQRVPDLVLLDLMMPQLDGLGFLHEFRRRFTNVDVPVYLMSAVRTAAEHARAAGVAGVFVKPFDLDELLETVGHVLRGRGFGTGGDAGRDRLMRA